MGTDARTYTPEQREEALRLYVEHGPAEAARRLGIPAATVRSWAKRAAKTSPRAQVATAGAEAARRSWSQRKHEVALLAGQEAEAIVRQMLATANARQKADLARAFAVMVEKTQLLDGGATGRVEVSESSSWPWSVSAASAFLIQSPTVVVEAQRVQPGEVLASPGPATGAVVDPAAQQQLADPVAHPCEVDADRLARAHEIAQLLLPGRRYSNRVEAPRRPAGARAAARRACRS